MLFLISGKVWLFLKVERFGSFLKWKGMALSFKRKGTALFISGKKRSFLKWKGLTLSYKLKVMALSFKRKGTVLFISGKECSFL